MIRILLADDHPVVRAGLASLLSDQSDIEIADMVGSPDEAVTRVAEGGIDLVLMDLRFGDTPGQGKPGAWMPPAGSASWTTRPTCWW